MTFVEMLLLIEERGEKHVEDKIHSIKTDKHFYVREGGEWVERELPPPIIEEVPGIPPEQFPKAEEIVSQKKKKK